MSDSAQGPGWWLASDGKWYPPESHPGRAAPAPPPTTEPGTFVAGGVTYELAGWWSRVGAGVIDILIALVVPILVSVFVAISINVVLGVLLGVLGVIAGWLYPSLMIWQTDGRTVGKRATNVRVVQESGRPFDAGTAFVREFVVKGVAVGIANSVTGGLAGLLNVLWPLWDEQNRAVHDMIVKTRVVHDRM